jgi:hypothetical protein
MNVEKYKFPDEAAENDKKEPEIRVEIVDDGKTEVEIVDDTPEKPKNYKKMEEDPKDADEDELSQYGEKVRRRIQHLQKGYHESRRQADIARQEREEAIKIAQKVVEENKKLKGSLNENQNSLLEQAKRVVAAELDNSRKRYKEAYEAGDSERLTQANEELAAAKVKFDRVSNYRPTPLQEDENEVQIPKSAPPRDEKYEEWREKNTWFGDDEEMTSLALAYHKKIVSAGADPSSDEYYEKINTRMRQKFPEYFGPEDDDDEAEETPAAQSRSKTNEGKAKASANVVAPASRSTAPKKVRLTESQVNIAKRLGVPLELYARKVAEQQTRG